MALSSVSIIPIYMMYIFFYTPGNNMQRMRNIFRPDVKLPGDRSDAPPPYSEVSMRVTSDGAVHV